MTEFEKNLIISQLKKLYQLFENLQEQVNALESEQKSE